MTSVRGSNNDLRTCMFAPNVVALRDEHISQCPQFVRMGVAGSRDGEMHCVYHKWASVEAIHQPFRTRRRGNPKAARKSQGVRSGSKSRPCDVGTDSHTNSSHPRTASSGCSLLQAKEFTSPRLARGICGCQAATIRAKERRLLLTHRVNPYSQGRILNLHETSPGSLRGIPSPQTTPVTWLWLGADAYPDRFGSCSHSGKWTS